VSEQEREAFEKYTSSHPEWCGFDVWLAAKREQKEADTAIADSEYEKLLELRGKANQVGDFAHGQRLDRAARTANDIAEAIRK
jgi:hypothetical protein